MKVKLISVTGSFIPAPDRPGETLTPEELLVFIARVSNPSNQANTETADRLINYLIQHKHWSPFDMVNMTIEVTTSRAIAHQILRHWSIKPQEFSQRYAEATTYEPIDIRLKADRNRQSSSESIGTVVPVEDEQGFRCLFLDDSNVMPIHRELLQKVSQHIEAADALYKELLSYGVAKECARFVLPLNTSTTMYLNGSVRSWIHYLEQRTSEHAQLEHRQLALDILSLFAQTFPNVKKALGWPVIM